ncbi:MCE family protein [Rhodococcus daqingensis]|uniref:MCE family protein n=1 Tax=Rhodococcus daqingensis TaxID=2479363 RepID=A0ABW2RZK6_9NOCA
MGRVTGCAAVLLAGAVLSGCGANFQHLPVGRDVDGPSYPIAFEFTDASLLPVGGEVRIGQAVVGRVSSMTVERFQAVVQADIDEDIRLPVGTTARIELTTPIGDAFINLRVPDQGDATTIPAGATIDASDTARGPDVAQLLAVVGTMLNGSGIAQVKTIVEESNQILAGREDVVRDLLGRVDHLLGTLDSRRDSINSAIDSLNRLSATVAAESATIDQGLRAAAPAVDVLAEQRQSVVTLLEKSHALSVQANAVLEQSGDQIVDIVGSLTPILDQFAAMGPTLGDTMGKLESARDLVLRAAPGDYVNIDLDVDLGESVRGLLSEVIPGAAPPVPAPPPAAPASHHPAIEGLSQLVTGGTR